MHKKIQTILLLSTIFSVAAHSPVLAEDVKAGTYNVTSDIGLKLNGFAHFQSGYRVSQKNLQADEKNISTARKSFAFYNEIALVANAFHSLDEVTYGAKLILSPTSSRKGGPAYNGSHLYLESDFGRTELGAPYVAATTMMIDGSECAAGTFDHWSRYANMSPKYLKQGKKIDPSFVTYGEFFMSDKLVTDLKNKAYSTEPARSIAYYTPNFEISDSAKLQFGVSYTPDSSNTGADSPSTQGSGITEKILEEQDVYKFVIDNTVKDAFSAGIALSKNISDGIDFKIALTGTKGTAAGKAKKFTKKDDTKPDATYSLSNLKEMNLGAILNIGNISLSASYGNLGNSVTSAEFHKTGRKTDYYTGTIAYKQAEFALSLSYFKGSQFKNTTDAIILGTSYKLAPGLSPYFEIVSFKLNGKPEYYPNLPKHSIKGVVALTGLKLSF